MAVNKVTIRDVARHAKVSTSTVSATLNSRSGVRISPDMRERVLSSVKSLKYRPSKVGRPTLGCAKPLSPSHRNKVVFLLDSHLHSTFGHVYDQVQRGIELELASRGMDLVIQNDLGFMLPIETCGIIVLGQVSKAKRKLIGNRPWIQTMDVIDTAQAHDHVTYNNAETGRLAARYLTAHHDRIGCICNTEKPLFVERFKHFRQKVAAAGKELLPLFGDLELYDADALELALKKYFKDNRPTGMFIMTDEITSSAYPLLTHLGILPGRDIEIVSCNNEYSRISVLRPYPTVIDICTLDIGRIAAMQLLSRLHYPKLKPLKMEILPRLIPSNEWLNDYKEQIKEIKNEK